MNSDLVIYLAMIAAAVIGYALGWSNGYQLGKALGFRRGKCVGRSIAHEEAQTAIWKMQDAR